MKDRVTDHDIIGTRPAPPPVDDLPLFGAPPIARTDDKATSHAAAEAMSSRGRLVRVVLEAFADAGATGLTADEVSALVPFDGAWKRISDCERLGYVSDTGGRRPGSSGRQQAVRAITPAGRAALEFR